VHIAARVCALAGAEEILVSSTVKIWSSALGSRSRERGVHD